MGGEGNVLGAIVGAMLIGVLQNEMVILKINPYWHSIVIYMVLAIAITVDYSQRMRRRRA
jgi:ribose transport system permease protein